MICHTCGNEPCDCAAIFVKYVHDADCSCYDCYWNRKMVEREAIRQQLEDILDRFINIDLKEHWFGCEHGKAAIGNAIISAIQRYE